MAETLQEFLVSLKYKQEDRPQFIDGIEDAGRKIIKLGTVLTGVTLAVSKYAQSMEQLGFVANRTKTTVDQLRALQVAGAALGSTAEGMQSSLEGLSRFLRNTPGSGSFLASIGVQTKDAKGNELDHTQIMKNLGASFRKMPQFMANQYAQILGIDENTELAMRSGDFDKQYDSFNADLKNAHLNETSASAHEAVNKGRHLTLKKEALESTIAKPLLDAFTAADKATHGLSTEIGAATLAVTSLATASIFAGKALRSILGKAVPAAAPAVAGEAAAGGLGLASLAAVGAGLLVYSPTLGTGQGQITDKQWANRPDDMKEPGNEVHGKIKRPASSAKESDLDKNLNGIMWAESRGNPNAVGRRADGTPSGALGAYQLMPKTAQAYHVNPLDPVASRSAAKAELSRLLKHYGGNTKLALQAYNWGQGNLDSYLKTGHGITSRAIPAETKNYPAQVEKGMTQNVTIHIAGSHDPLATGKAVHKALTRQYQLASRNTAGVTR